MQVVFNERMNREAIKPNREKALFLAKRQLSELVCDAVNLEGIHYTLPEVQTLLGGITIGGHKLSDQVITLNQANAWQFVFDKVKAKKFELNKQTLCELHAIAAEEEALQWGQFRTGGVTIAGTDYLPPQADKLDEAFAAMREQAKQISDPYQQAIFVFLQMARNQFFYDVNKRMGRFVMNGLLLSQGYPAINLPAKRKEEFNRLMLEFYQSNNTEPMTEFMLSCLDPQLIKIMSE
jgi:Fic family protein